MPKSQHCLLSVRSPRLAVPSKQLPRILNSSSTHRQPVSQDWSREGSSWLLKFQHGSS